MGVRPEPWLVGRICIEQSGGERVTQYKPDEGRYDSEERKGTYCGGQSSWEPSKFGSK